jgi:cell division transport system permease protein
MKTLRILGRDIADAFKSVIRNLSLSMASISCITITLLVVAISVILTYNVRNFANLVEQDVTIVAFLKTSVTADQVTSIEDKIKSINNVDVDTVTYESKTEIANDMMSSSETYKQIMSSWTAEENPLQDTIQVKVKDVEKIGDTANSIKGVEGVDIVKYGEGMIEQLVSLLDLIKKVCYGIVIALIIVTFFLIANTIKITIYSRRREIEIMRLVGASNVNIKIPFIFEGLFLGALGAVIPSLVTIYGYNALYTHFNGQLFSPFIKLIVPVPFVYSVTGALFIIGILVGVVGSLGAVSKYLKI